MNLFIDTRINMGLIFIFFIFLLYDHMKKSQLKFQRKMRDLEEGLNRLSNM